MNRMSLHSAPTSPTNKPNADKRRETAERMRKWRASNAEKNRENDTRCRVYRVARERFGTADTPAKAAWIHEEIVRRTERRRLRDAKKAGHSSLSTSSSSTSPTQFDSGSRAFMAWLPIDMKKGVYSKSVPSPYPTLPPLCDPTPYNPIHLPSMEPSYRPSTLDYTSSQALTRLNMAAINFLIT